MATPSSAMFRRQIFSHGWGQVRPTTNGKGLRILMVRRAFSLSPRIRWPTKTGTLICAGHFCRQGARQSEVRSRWSSRSDRVSIRMTPRGQASAQRPHPLHRSGSIRGSRSSHPDGSHGRGRPTHRCRRPGQPLSQPVSTRRKAWPPPGKSAGPWYTDLRGAMRAGPKQWTVATGSSTIPPPFPVRRISPSITSMPPAAQTVKPMPCRHKQRLGRP